MHAVSAEMGAPSLQVWALGCAVLLAHPLVPASEHAPINYIPVEMRKLFHPDEVITEEEHRGFLLARPRGRRDNVVAGKAQDPENAKYTYSLYKDNGEPCILVQTDCSFELKFWTKRRGRDKTRVVLPKDPEVTGRCVREGDTAVLSLLWDVFNFTLVWTETAERDMYYLNRAVLNYKQDSPLFRGATHKGNVYLQTRPGVNFYFTDMGKSYKCEDPDDQGPLNLYNLDEEPMGSMALEETKFQPFVKRAKGEWGYEHHCLPKYIQVMREEVVPYVVSCVFLGACVVIVAGYGIFRRMNVKKPNYGFYGDGGPPEGAGGGDVFAEEEVEAHELGQVKQISNGGAPPPTQEEAYYAEEEEAAAEAAAAGAAAPASNPFKSKAASNPFGQYKE